MREWHVLTYKRSIVFLAFLWLVSTPKLVSANYVLGVYPSNDPKALLIPMRTMAAYLSEQTGEEFTVVISRDYTELSQRLREGSVDLAWLNPINYIKIKKAMPDLNYVATYMEENSSGEITAYYYSFIITRRDSGIESIKDAQGTLFAFTDQGSTSGYAYPNNAFQNQGINPQEYFKRVFFLGRHDRVIEALVLGSVQVGAVSDGTYASASQKHGDIFRILLRSNPIPLDAIVAHPNVPEDIQLRVQRALVAMPKDHPFCILMREHLSWSAAGFSVLGGEIYNAMREIVESE